MTAKANRIRNNAILKFGMKMTMKKKSSCVLLAIISALTTLILAITAFAMKESSSSVSDYSEAGQILFIVLSSLHLALCVFLSPAISGSAISGEREKQTFDVMLCSQMTPRDIVWGKFLSSISWILLISVSLLPSYAIIYIFGGISVATIVLIFAMIVWMTAVCSAISIMMSAVIKRTSGAVVLALVTLFGLIGVNMIFLGLYYALFSLLEAMWYESHGYMSTVVYRAFGNTYSTPYSWYNDIISPVLWFNPVFAFLVALIGLTLGNSEIMDFFGFGSGQHTVGLIMTMVVNLVFYTAIGLGALKIAENAVNPMIPDRSEKKRKKKQEKARRERLREEKKAGIKAQENSAE